MTRRTTRWAACLRILCALALLSVGFAHRPAMAAGPDAFELARYVLPDGTMPDLCIDDMVDGKTGHAAPPKCEACRISGDLLMPEPADLSGVALAFRHVAVRPHAGEALHQRRERPGAPPRAPPFLSA